MAHAMHREKPLAGVRVLDLTRVLAGPYCTMILADLGAEVVKIERPDVGDDARQFGPFLPSGLSGYFASINRGKKSITLDLKEAADRQIFLRLVEKADVVIENFRPGTMESFGVGEDRLKSVNPKLVFVSASGFGRDGLYGKRAAYDIIVQAMSGLMSVTGPEPRHSRLPVRVGTSISDILTGMFAAIAVLAGLRAVDRDGQGVGLDMAMLDCTVAAMENALARTEITGEAPEPLGTRHPSITPFQAFETADRPIVIAAGNDGLWRKMCQAMGAAALGDDPRFATNPARTDHCEAMEHEVAAILATRPAAHWLEVLDQAGVPCAPVRDMTEVLADEHLAARQMFHTIDDGSGRPFRTAGSPLRFNDLPMELSRHVPKLGEHQDEILRDWLGEAVAAKQ